MLTKSYNKISTILYSTLLFFTIFTFIFCCVRLSYTTTPRSDKSLFNGNSFYDPSVVELLVTSIFTIAWVVFLFLSIWKKLEHVFLTRIWFEYAMLSFLSLMWVGGAGAASTVWPNLSWCTQYSACRILQAMMGFAWLSWICVTLLVILNVVQAVREPDPNRWERHEHMARKPSLSGTGAFLGRNPSASFTASMVQVPQEHGTPMSSFRFPPQHPSEQV